MRRDTKSPWHFLLMLTTCLACLSGNGYAQKKEKPTFREQFIDSTDNAFDVSGWLSQVYGVFPLATITTEPATGFGLGGGLVHIKRKAGTKWHPLY